MVSEGSEEEEKMDESYDHSKMTKKTKQSMEAIHSTGVNQPAVMKTRKTAVR